MTDGLDLSVVTPGGQLISATNPTDAISGGTFTQGDIVIDTTIVHESVVTFLLSEPPDGTYKACVTNGNQIGDPDPYFLGVLAFGELTPSDPIITLNGQSYCQDLVYSKV